MLPLGIVTVVSVALALAAYAVFMTVRTTQPSETAAVPEQELTGAGVH
jgi:hypothetical protein